MQVHQVNLLIADADARSHPGWPSFIDKLKLTLGSSFRIAVASDLSQEKAIDPIHTVIDLTTHSVLSNSLARKFRHLRLLDEQGHPLFSSLANVETICRGEGAKIALYDVMSADQGRLLDVATVSCHPLVSLAGHMIALHAADMLLKTMRIPIRGIVQSIPHPPRTFPGWRIYLSLLGTYRYFINRLHHVLFEESWMIGIIHQPIAQLSLNETPCPISWLTPRGKAAYHADPFPLPGSDNDILCEEFPYSQGKGRIVRVSMQADNEVVVTAQRGPWGEQHLSYPFTFEEDGVIYCIVESSQLQRCDLYRMKSVDEWTLVTPILRNVAAADATLIRHEGHYWLLYTDLALGANDNLCIAYAPQLEGPWMPHLLNPVKRDARSSRCAGTPFLIEGVWHRPSQNCLQRYGASLTINRIDSLTPFEFRESIIRRFTPDPKGTNPHGLHHLSEWGNKTLVDGKRHVLIPAQLKQKLTRRLCCGMKTNSNKG